MAVCEYCNKDMLEVKTCAARDPEVVIKNDTEFCGDCGVGMDGLHHPGCDMEFCSQCGEQWITCDCNAKLALLKVIE